MDPKKWQLYDQIAELADKLDILHHFDIAGVEVSQATQHYQSAQHLTDTADQGPDNSIQLVAYKPAWVRVYLTSILGVSVTGTLEVQRRKYGVFHTVTTLSPVSATPVLVPGSSQYDYATNRSTLGSTLNFVIPGNDMIGTLRLIARASHGSHTAEETTTVAVTLRQTLRLAGVMIAYDGPAGTAANAPNLTIAAPTLADLQGMAATALTLFPVQSTADFRTAGSLTLTFPLIDPGPFPTSGCGASWDNLHGQVANARTADGNQPGWIYYGLLPAGVPTGMVGGCGGGGVAVGPVNNPGTLAHEAGHAAGLKHAPAGGAPNPDPNYPAYEPYDTTSNKRASIGEYGLDINNGNISSPQTFRDFMAYGGPSWISPYHYGKLLSNASLNPATVGIDHPWWKDLVWEEYMKWPWPPFPEPDPPVHDFDLELPVFPPPWPPKDVISLIVQVDEGRIAEVLHVARTHMFTRLDRTAATPFVAQLRGDHGEVLATAPLLRLVEDEACGCGDTCDKADNPKRYLAQVLLEDVAAGAALVIRDADGVAWERKAPAEPVRVHDFEAALAKEGVLGLRWKASGEPVEFWLQWSTDGETWHALATGLTGSAAQLAPQQLPSGKILVRLVAHDGFFSAVSEPVEIRLPERAPQVAILHPKDKHTYSPKQLLRLWGSAADGQGHPVDSEQAVWLLDGIEIGSGLDTWATLEPGEHKLTLLLRSKAGYAEASISVVIKGPR